MKRIKLAIAIPSRDVWKSDFGMSFGVMMATTAMAHTDYALSIVTRNAKGASLAMNRNDLCQWAIDQAATHILFLDDDMRIPPDTALRLIAAGQMVVAANCARREYPPAPTAKGFDDKLVYTRETSTGLEPVRSVGTGVMMIETEVFSHIPKPWFCEDPVGRVGEDVWFCRAVQNANVPIWIDHDLSKGVIHIGEFEYDHQKVPGWSE